jgi:hypothetical protein
MSPYGDIRAKRTSLSSPIKENTDLLSLRSSHAPLPYGTPRYLCRCRLQRRELFECVAYGAALAARSSTKSAPRSAIMMVVA